MEPQWEIGLFNFRECGGVADNIIQKIGSNGRGIFPANANKKTKIFVPSALLVNKEDVALEGKDLRIKNQINYPQEVVKFFDHYQKNFSWGNGGMESTRDFEEGLAKFPQSIKNFLKENGIINIYRRHAEFSDELVLEIFLKNRGFKFKGASVLAPYLELVNHSPNSSSLITTNEGIHHPDIELSDKEITHHYRNMSPLARWVQCGFSTEEPMVFSLPLEFKAKKVDLNFFCEGKSLTREQTRFIKKGNTFMIEGLPIANTIMKDFPLNYLTYVFQKLDVNMNAKNFLENILAYNTKIRAEAITRLDSLNTTCSRSLIKALRIELQTIEQSRQP